MESDRANTTSLDGVSGGLQKMRPLHGRTSGPTRRSTKGQWTAEEDDILREAVHRFKGKNWKKIAECFKDRTDVQCLHRWQKVLNPELIKGPWSKEEDEIMIELVNKYGPKKWSTIAQHLPGRIGKQCRERWHNHLNPAINKEAWTQKEELALIRAHQIYGNKWAELTKFLPGRTDNSIKNHWNSSVKKKLDSYLQSGLLEQFQGLPHVSHLNQSMPSSSSKVQQSSGDDSVRQGGTEREEISECSQGSTVVACSQSTSDMANAVVHTREECRLTEESSHGQGPSSSPASCSENYYTSFQEVAISMPEIPCELGGSSKFFEHNFSHDGGTSAGKDWKLSLTELPNISSLDLGQELSGSLLQCVGGNEDHEVVSFPLQTSVGLNASTSMGNMIMASEKPEHTFIPEDGYCRMTYAEAGSVGSFSSGNLTKCSNIIFSSGNRTKCSNIIDMDRSTDMVLCQSSNFEIPEVDTLASQSYYPLRSDMLGISCGQSLSITSKLPSDDGALIYGVDPKQFNDPSLRSQEEALLSSTYDGFIYTNDSTNSPCDDGTDNIGLQEQPDHAKDSSKLVPVDDFGSRTCNNIQSCPSKDEVPAVPAEQQDAGALFYEPPRFPSLDIPFFSCDLIQSSSDMQQDFSPLGIRQLMMSSMNYITPFRLWDSPSGDDSPDAVLKSAAKTFTCTPSILKKRHRDLVSPLSEQRSEKKLESDVTRDSFSRFTTDFSLLEVMFDENGNQQAPLLSLSDNKRNAEVSAEDKENLRNAFGVGKEEGREGNAFLENKISEKDFDNSKLQDGIKLGTIGTDGRTKGDGDTAAQTVQQPSAVLVEQNLNDLLFFSPDRFGLKSDRVVGPSAGSLGNWCSRRLEVASNQGSLSEFSSKDLCSYFVSPPTDSRKKDASHLGAVTYVQSAPSTTLPEITAENSKNDAGVENLSIFGETPFKRSIESPSAWKSPWFINSFLPGPRVDTDITVEDIGYFVSPGDRSYDAIGLMKQLSEHTAAAFADAQEVLGDETPETILKRRCSNNLKAADQEDDQIPQSQPEKCSVLASNILTEGCVLDFSECGTPGKRTESGRFTSAISFTSPSSYLLKGCR